MVEIDSPNNEVWLRALSKALEIEGWDGGDCLRLCVISVEMETQRKRLAKAVALLRLQINDDISVDEEALWEVSVRALLARIKGVDIDD